MSPKKRKTRRRRSARKRKKRSTKRKKRKRKKRSSKRRKRSWKKKRRGRKSSAQTKATPAERAQRGSTMNKRGSAKGKGGPAIKFDKTTIASLKKKVKAHNKRFSVKKKKVTLTQLKKVYRRGAGAFSASHRPGKTRAQWAFARVNMFTKMKAGGKVKKAYRDADGDIK